MEGTWPEPMGQVVCAIKSRPGEIEPIRFQKTVSDIELYPVGSRFDLIDCVLIFSSLSKMVPNLFLIL